MQRIPKSEKRGGAIPGPLLNNLKVERYLLLEQVCPPLNGRVTGGGLNTKLLRTVTARVI